MPHEYLHHQGSIFESGTSCRQFAQMSLKMSFGSRQSLPPLPTSALLLCGGENRLKRSIGTLLGFSGRRATDRWLHQGQLFLHQSSKYYQPGESETILLSGYWFQRALNAAELVKPGTTDRAATSHRQPSFQFGVRISKEQLFQRVSEPIGRKLPRTE